MGRAARTALVVAFVAAALALAPGTGWAGDGLASSDPPEGAALATAPAAVVLTFSAPVDPGQSHVSAQDDAGRDLGADTPTAVGRAGLRLPVSIRTPGDYTIAYHVVFDDGTDAVGVLRFSVGTGKEPAALDADAQRQARQNVTSGHDHTVDPLSGTLLVADLAVLLGALLLLSRRAPRRSLDLPDAPADQE